MDLKGCTVAPFILRGVSLRGIDSVFTSRDISSSILSINSVELRLRISTPLNNRFQAIKVLWNMILIYEHLHYTQHNSTKKPALSKPIYFERYDQ